MKVLLSLVVILILAFSGSQVFGQQSLTGQTPTNDITVRIDESGTAHVIHKITGFSLKPFQVEMIKGNMTNFSVVDANGSSVQYAEIQKSPKSIVLNLSQRNMTQIRYDLVNSVSKKDGVWTWNYFEPTDTDYTNFYFPKGVDTIWSNERPVYIGEKGIRQHGNGFTLQYVINEPVKIQDVKWQDMTFTVGIKTVSGVGEYVFDQSQKAFAFNIDKANVPITVIMPQKLLWGPYDVTINENKTLHGIFHNNGTHAWIGLMPNKSGTVQITGTTVIPEFPLFIPLVIGISTVIFLRFSERLRFN